MAEVFDPYYIWLGIPPEEQPADHYRLLGIRRFESNDEVIANAADQRVRHLRSMQAGKRQAETQKLLNEIAAASGTLLDPDRKGTYDAGLVASSSTRNSVAAAAARGTEPARSRPTNDSSLPAARPIRPPNPQQPASAIAPVQAAPLSRSQSAPTPAVAGRASSKKWLIIAGMASTCGLVLLAGVSYFVLSMLMGFTQPPAANLPTVRSPGTVLPAPEANPPVAPFVPANHLPAWLADYERQNDFKFAPLAAARSYAHKAKVDKLMGRIELQDFQEGSCGIDAELPAWFVLDAKVTRLEGDGPLRINFILGGTSQSLVLDGNRERGYLSGPSDVRGNPLEVRRDATVHTGQLFPVNAATMISLYMGNGSVCCVLKRDQKTEPIFTWHEPGFVTQAGEFRGTSLTPTLQIWNKSSRWVVDDLQITPLCLKGDPGLAYNTFGSPGPPPWVNEWAMKGRSLKLMALFYGMNPLAGERMAVERNGEIRTSANGSHSVEFETLPPANYYFRVDLDRVGQGAMAVDFPVGGKQCRIVLDRLIDKTYWSGIEVLGGVPLQSRQDPSVARGQQVLENHSTFLDVLVHQSRVSAKVVSGEQKSYITWSGNPELLGRSSEFPLASAGKIGLSSRDAAYTLRPLLAPLGDEPLVASNVGNKAPPPSLRPKIPAAAPLPQPASPAAAAKSPVSPPVAGETSKLPVPAATELAKARETLQAMYGDIERKGKLPAEKLSQAQSFVTLSVPERDPAVRYALLDAARRLAMDGQDVGEAMAIAAQLGAQFEVDTLAVRLETLKLAEGTTLPISAWESAAELAADLATAAQAKGQLGMADAASQMAIDHAAHSKSTEFKKGIKRLRDNVTAQLQLWEVVKTAEKTLEAMPDDPGANLAMGKWHCLHLGDWDKGTSYLAKCGDVKFATAARAELDARLLAAADIWAGAALTLTGAEKLAAQKHALELYQEASEKLKGLEQLKAAKRATELTEILAQSDSQLPATGGMVPRSRLTTDVLRPGLLVRVYASQPPKLPTPALGVIRSYGDFLIQREQLVRELKYDAERLCFAGVGYIDLDKDESLLFHVRNGILLVDGNRVIANNPAARVTTGPKKKNKNPDQVRRTLKQGRHTLQVLPYDYTVDGPHFRITHDNGESVILYSPDDLEAELAKPVSLHGVSVKGKFSLGNR